MTVKGINASYNKLFPVTDIHYKVNQCLRQDAGLELAAFVFEIGNTTLDNRALCDTRKPNSISLVLSVVSPNTE